MPLLYPDYFYYIDKQEAALYSQNPQGTLDVARFINNQAAWKKESYAHALKKKTLIIADWTASSWSIEKLRAVKEILKQLLESGFPLALWQDDQIIPLTSDNLSCLDDENVRQRMTPSFQDTLRQCAINQLQITHGHIGIVDDYQLNYLLDPNLKERDVSLDELSHSTHGPPLFCPL